ncbi:unnamed protein product [Symbiodinium sp. CCMP2592]|nr:unnamed protein product [Symbiodinium sp. CCMP2592]
MTQSSQEAAARSRDGVPQWDGNSATFARYEEEALLWQEGIAWHKRYMLAPKLLAELQGAARRMVVGKPPGWVSYQGGVEVLMKHLRECLGKPQMSELSEYLNMYFRNSRRRSGESMNEYVTRKSEIYLRAQQALGRVRPQHEAKSTRGVTEPTAPTTSRRSSWTSEATSTTAAEDMRSPMMRTLTKGTATLMLGRPGGVADTGPATTDRGMAIREVPGGNPSTHDGHRAGATEIEADAGPDRRPRWNFFQNGYKDGTCCRMRT